MVLAGWLFAAGQSSIHADTAETSESAPPVDVLQVSGLFDDIVVDTIHEAIERAESGDAQALILQVDSPGAVVDQGDIAELVAAVADATVPIAVWIGPSGSTFTGSPAQILAVADVTGMAPGSTVGNLGRPVSDRVVYSPGLSELTNRTVGLGEARDLDIFQQRISDLGIATFPNMLDALDGYEENGVVLNTTIEATTDSGTVQRETIAPPRFFKLSLIDELFHTVASPEVAYLLLLTGLALIVFEFFTAGIGIAAAVGAGCLILSFSGLAELPTRPWAVVAVLVAMLAFAVDVQVGVPRFWTGVGIVLTVAASFFLFAPVDDVSLRPSWLSLIAGIGGIVLTFIVGMPSMTRTRFATPTVGREWMIGSEGVAIGPIDNEGVARINDADWRASVNRATPIASGDPLRVVAIDGVTLEVEPLEGAARDYREMRTSPAAPSPSTSTPTDE